MKQAIEVFMDYAAAFEQTYVDDDWKRLEKYFAKDAVYEVRGGPLVCKITGPSAIFTGIKKSLDGMDRLCSERKIHVTDGPEMSSTDAGEEISLGWVITYVYGEAPEVELIGRTVVTAADGVIVEMRDEYTDEDMAHFGKWMLENNVDIDGSYV
jgi:hypothetical protein